MVFYLFVQILLLNTASRRGQYFSVRSYEVVVLKVTEQITDRTLLYVDKVVQLGPVAVLKRLMSETSYKGGLQNALELPRTFLWTSINMLLS